MGDTKKKLRPLGHLPLAPLKMALTPSLGKKSVWIIWYSNWPAWTHSFNAEIRFKKHALSLKISAKMCQILLVWFGRPILDTVLVISWDSVHIFQNRFLHWNREIEPVDYHEPHNLNNFFSPLKASEKFWGSHPQAKNTPHSKTHFFTVSIYHWAMKYE